MLLENLMPNWCDNMATISHKDKTKIDELEQVLLTGKHRLFHAFRPMPVSEENWYQWNVQNWGTKWDANMHDWKRKDDNTILVKFDTAWSAPIVLYKHMFFELGYAVKAVYNEPGMGFGGVFEDGEDYYNEYDITSQESIDALPDELIEFGDLQRQHEDWVEENIQTGEENGS